MHQGTDQYPMRTNSSRNLIMVNFSAYLNKFETFFTVTLASTGVSSRLTMTIGSTTRPSAPERTPSVRKTRLATTSTTTPCPRSTSQVGSLTQFYSLSFLLQACFLYTFEKTQGENNSMFWPSAKNSRIFSQKTQSYEAQSKTWWYRILALKL